MKMSGVGLVFLALLEGYSSTPYQDVVGVWTNGFGETKGVTSKSVTTPPKALKRFIVSVDDEHGKGMKKCINDNVHLKQHQYDAFLSFTYNIGVAGFCRSNTRKLINEGKIKEACKAMSGWYKPKAIIGRRNKEIAYCLGLTNELGV